MEILESKSSTSPFVERLLKSYPKGDAAVKSDSSKGFNLRFPTRKDEFWKYTPTKAIEKTDWSFNEISEANFSLPEEAKGPKLVFVNGFLNPAISDQGLIDQFIKVELSPALREDDAPFNPLTDLNELLPQASYKIRLGKNQAFDGVIQIVHVFQGQNSVAQPYSQIELESGASAKLNIWNLHIEGKTFSNSRTSISLGENANLSVDFIQEGSKESFDHTDFQVNQARDSRFTLNTFTLSGNWVRNNVRVNILGENSEANLNGVYIPANSELVDNHTIIDHKVAHCESNELYRGILMDKSTGVFNGKVFVRPDAQKTNAFQSNGNVLLSDFATINSKPELEIYADDVKCSHGSTTGQMDEEALFYLMSRGISEQNSRILLVNAFAEDVINKLTNPELRNYIEEAIKAKLSGAGK